MKMVFIYGPPAVGKSTVAKELATITNFRYFTNHQASDPVRALIDFESNPSQFRHVANRVKNLILESAIDMKLPGMIMTFCYSPPDSDRNLKETMEMFKMKGCVDQSFVRLDCSDEELYRRVSDPSRSINSVRKITSPDQLRIALSKNGFRNEIPYVENLFIDNTRLGPREVARRIIVHYGFVS